jgi:hypothetical protein
VISRELVLIEQILEKGKESQMLIRIALIALGLIVTCLTQTIEVFAQASTPAGTMTGCLMRSGSPGFYLVQEEGTGLTTTVAASDDLQKYDLEKYSTGSKVKLTGRLIREEGRDVFRVTNVEQLSPICETTTVHVSVESIKDAVGRATFGIRGGIGLDPELPFLGAHAQLGPIFKAVWFRPSYEFGFGEVTKIHSFNFDFAYYPDLTLRGKGMDRADSWNVYFGAGGALHVSHRHFEEEAVNIDFGDWEANGALNIFMGMSKRSGLFTELRAGAYSSTSPTIKFIIGYTFRRGR